MLKPPSSKGGGGFMREHVLSDYFLVDTTKGDRDTFNFDFDWGIQKNRQGELAKEWKDLAGSVRQDYGNKIENYWREKGVPDLNDPAGFAAKNVYLFKSEIDERVNAQDILHLLPIDELYHSTSLMELLHNIENIDHIKELYLKRKLNAKGGGCLQQRRAVCVIV